MQTEEIQVEMFVLPNGKAPFEDWLRALRDRKARAKVEVRIARLRLGNFGDHRSVGESIYELRIDYGPGYRVYYAVIGSKVILLLCGGDKRRQGEDIKKAKEYFSNYRTGTSEGDKYEESDQEI